MSDVSLFEAGPVVDKVLMPVAVDDEEPVAESVLDEVLVAVDEEEAVTDSGVAENVGDGLAAEISVAEGLATADPVASAAGSDAATFPALPLSNVLKCVKASTHLLQTKAAKGMLARSAAYFTVYLASQ